MADFTSEDYKYLEGQITFEEYMKLEDNKTPDSFVKPSEIMKLESVMSEKNLIKLNSKINYKMNLKEYKKIPNIIQLKYRIDKNKESLNQIFTEIKHNKKLICININELSDKFRSTNDALFFKWLVNADILQHMFQNTPNQDLGFITYVYQKIPIPEYDPKNKFHNDLVKLAFKAEKVSMFCPDKVKATIDFLRKNEVARDIDRIVKKILPDYVS